MPASLATAPSPAASQVHHLQFSRASTKKLLEGIAVDKRCAQTSSCSNHALWTMGHLATVDDYFLNEFAGGGLKLPEAWHTIFGMGSKPEADASKYPSFDEVSRAFDERRSALVKWFESLSQAKLQAPTSEGWEKYAPTLGDVAPFMAWHEGYHCGQLATLRKSFGLPAAFG